MSTPPADGDTVKLVPLRELTDLARVGLAMRRAQLAEKRFEDAAKAAINRERASHPGMGEEGGAPA